MKIKEAIEHCDEIINKMDNCECRKEHEELKEFLEELQEYKDTGLTPEQIRELKERDTAKEIQKVDEQPYFRKRFHSYICPVCHKKVEFGWLFCGHCGQKLKKKD